MIFGAIVDTLWQQPLDYYYTIHPMQLIWQKGRFSLIASCPERSGRGLSEDGLWRRHSWLINREQELIETSTARVKYFGVSLSDKQAAAFSTAYLDA